MGFGDSTRINTNIQSLQAYASLQKTNARLGNHQLRLATGSRINTAEDDSAGYSIAKKLEAKVRGQAQALSNIGDAKSMLTVAEGSLNSVMDILQTMKEKAVQAANDSMGTEERKAIKSQLDELYTEINDVLTSTEFNGTKLFGASSTTLNFQVGASGTEATDNFVLTIDALDVTSLLGAGTSTTSYSAATDVSGWNGGTVAVSNAGSAAQTLTLSVVDNSGTLELHWDDGTNNGVASANLTQAIADGDTLTANGVEFTIAPGGTPADGESFTINVTESTTTGSNLTVDSNTNARASIATIDSAIQTLSNNLAKLGDAQNRLSFKQENLQTSMNNYEAARSRIIDADFAKEQMEIVKLQILQQTGTAALAQANAAPQAVLSLF